MTSFQLQQWILHPESLNRESLYELRTLVARYPYFQSLRLLYLKNLFLLHDINFGVELRKAVLYVAEVLVLRYMLDDPANANAAQDRTNEALAVKML